MHYLHLFFFFVSTVHASPYDLFFEEKDPTPSPVVDYDNLMWLHLDGSSVGSGDLNFGTPFQEDTPLSPPSNTTPTFSIQESTSVSPQDWEGPCAPQSLSNTDLLRVEEPCQYTLVPTKGRGPWKRVYSCETSSQENRQDERANSRKAPKQKKQSRPPSAEKTTPKKRLIPPTSMSKGQALTLFNKGTRLLNSKEDVHLPEALKAFEASYQGHNAFKWEACLGAVKASLALNDMEKSSMYLRLISQTSLCPLVYKAEALECANTLIARMQTHQKHSLAQSGNNPPE
ncbi:MAG: hypothetical protein C0514_05810 [Candidatus Puniceispirillum sp.]|nr:hypothetical protein [Candidatus Puniceispirillum sp.]